MGLLLWPMVFGTPYKYVTCFSFKLGSHFEMKTTQTGSLSLADYVGRFVIGYTIHHSLQSVLTYWVPVSVGMLPLASKLRC